MRLLALIAFYIIFIILDRKGVVYYSNILVFLLHICIIPLVAAISGVLLAFTLPITVMTASTNDYSAAPSCAAYLFISTVLGIYVLKRVCKNPANENKYDFSYSFDNACVKRLNLFRKLTFIPAVITGIISIVYVVSLFITSGAVMVKATLNPSFLLFSILTFGLGYFIVMLITLASSAVLFIPIIGVIIFSAMLYVASAVFSFALIKRVSDFGNAKIHIKLLYILWAVSMLVFPINIITSILLSKKIKKSAAMLA